MLHWFHHWDTLIDEAKRCTYPLVGGEPPSEVLASAAVETARGEDQAREIANRITEALDDKLHLIAVNAKRAAKSSEVAALAAKEVFTLAEVTKILNVSDNSLRDKGLLNDLGENAFDPDKLNGTRKSRKRKSGWRFHAGEVERYARVFNAGEASSDDQDDGLEIRGT